MSLKVREEHLWLESQLGENTVEAVFQGTVELPSAAANIQRVVWTRGSGIINDLKVFEDKVNIEGVIDVQLVYVEELEGEEEAPPSLNQVQWQGAVPFTHAVEIIGAQPGMRAEVSLAIMSCDWELRPDGRTLDVDVLAKTQAAVYQGSSYNVVTGATIGAPKKLVVDDYPINTKVALKEIPVKKDIAGILDVPEGYGAIADVLDLQVKPIIDDTDVLAGKVVFKGTAIVELLYANQEAGIERLVWERKLPFQFEATDDVIGNDVELTPVLQIDATEYVVNDGGALRLELLLHGKIAVKKEINARAVLNLSSPSGEQVETRKDTIRVDNIVNEKNQQSSAQGVIELSEKYPPIREILRTTGKAHIDDYRIDDDKVIVEGAVDIEIVYLAHSDGEYKQLYSGIFPNAVVIQQVVVIGGVEPGMTGQVTIEVKDIRPDLINRETIEVEAIVRSAVRVTQATEQEVVVEALEVSPADPDPPTITYVVTQPSDTLWKLAKRYHTTVEAILNANSWLRDSDEDILKPTQKICIPRKPLVKQQ